MPRQAAPAFDAFQHRRFFAANIGAGAAAQMDRGRPWLRGGDLSDGRGEALVQVWVFVAQIDIDILRLDRPRRDQHAFEKAEGVALQYVAVLEGAGLAFIGIDDHEAWPRLGAHEAPFPPGRESGPA